MFPGLRLRQYPLMKCPGRSLGSPFRPARRALARAPLFSSICSQFLSAVYQKLKGLDTKRPGEHCELSLSLSLSGLPCTSVRVKLVLFLVYQGERRLEGDITFIYTANAHTASVAGP